jgi:hypothetical protein
MSDEGKAAQKEPKPRVGCVSRAVYIGIVAVLILSFAAGTMYLLWVQPAARENQALTAQLQAANSELATLRPLVAENKKLSGQVEQAGLKLLVLTALVHVNAARVSLAQGDASSAAARLAAIDKGLADLAGRVEGEPAAAVGQMRARLTMVSGEIQGDAFAAQRDLEVLANDLSQLAESLPQG